MRVTGASEVSARLRYFSVKIPENARKAMHREADKIVKEAQLNAPVDRHNLENSIRKIVGYEGRGRLKINIEAGGYVNGVNVDQYAALVHEDYENDVAYVNGPGPGTLAKMAANPGRYIGSKFLERAMNESRKKLADRMIAALFQGETF